MHLRRAAVALIGALLAFGSVAEARPRISFGPGTIQQDIPQQLPSRFTVQFQTNEPLTAAELVIPSRLRPILTILPGTFTELIPGETYSVDLEALPPANRRSKRYEGTIKVKAAAVPRPGRSPTRRSFDGSLRIRLRAIPNPPVVTEVTSVGTVRRTLPSINKVLESRPTTASPSGAQGILAQIYESIRAISGSGRASTTPNNREQGTRAQTVRSLSSSAPSSVTESEQMVAEGVGRGRTTAAFSQRAVRELTTERGTRFLVDAIPAVEYPFVDGFRITGRSADGTLDVATEVRPNALIGGIDGFTQTVNDFSGFGAATINLTRCGSPVRYAGRVQLFIDRNPEDQVPSEAYTAFSDFVLEDAPYIAVFPVETPELPDPLALCTATAFTLGQVCDDTATIVRAVREQDACGTLALYSRAVGGEDEVLLEDCREAFQDISSLCADFTATGPAGYCADVTTVRDVAADTTLLTAVGASAGDIVSRSISVPAGPVQAQIALELPRRQTVEGFFFQEELCGGSRCVRPAFETSCLEGFPVLKFVFPDGQVFEDPFPVCFDQGCEVVSTQVGLLFPGTPPLILIVEVNGTEIGRTVTPDLR
jgi:hypothetical protein